MQFLSLLIGFFFPVLLLGSPAVHETRDAGFDIIDLLPDLSTLLVDTVLPEIVAYLALHPDVDAAFPGLQAILTSVSAGLLDDEEYARGLLIAIQDHDAFTTAFAELDSGLQANVTAFINGESAASITKRGFSLPPSPGVKKHFTHMAEAGNTPASRRWLNGKRQTTPVVYADANNTIPVTVYVAADFENWGLTVSNTPSYTFVPTTIIGMQNIVKYAISQGKRVRAAGYRHTWTDMFSEDDQIFVSMLDLATATAVPDPSSLLPENPLDATNEFKVIQLADTDVEGSNGQSRLCRVGAAVTNEEMRRWIIANGEWTLPINVVMVETTLGGSSVPMCHGAGYEHQTMADLLRKVEYVDANGVHQTIDDPDQLKAAAGSLGLLGVVTHVTYELKAATYAAMTPLKQDINLAIPPPDGFTVPIALQGIYTQAELDAARDAFVAKAQGSYYAEYFWFPYQQKAFVNTWNDTTDASDLEDYPSYPELFLQWVEGWLGGVINDDVLFQDLPGYWQAVILSSLAMLALPDNNIKTYLIDALHFRRGVQNMRVRDMELQIPLPPSADDPSTPDWSLVQQAWWDAIAIVYEDETAPMRIALEMRIMGDSDIIMAAQTNNTLGTASIEVLTTMAAVANGVWDPFVQKVMDKWMSYGDNGQTLNIRPHWAKEWDQLTVNNGSWRTYMKDVAYKDAIPQFLNVVEDIGSAQNWTLNATQSRFSCQLLDDIIFS